MKRIVVLTATRAEYGLLSPIIKKLNKIVSLDVKVVVTGTHLSREFGMTVEEIRNDGIEIDKEIDILMSADTPVAISKTMGLALMGFGDYFCDCKPDALMVLGDRYETLAVCAAALIARIPIIHLYGGEATIGLIDEAVRNAITKMSYLHFTSTEKYKSRVIQMGEYPERVFCVGAMGVENAINTNLYAKKELLQMLGCNENIDYAVMTYHPVTLAKNDSKQSVYEILKAIEYYPNLQFICTKANADMEGRKINEILEKYEEDHDNFYLFDSLGEKRYLSSLKYAKFVIGNSSSGIIEAPSFGIPTINIGKRQEGRIQAESIINCNCNTESIRNAINIALSETMQAQIKYIQNPYEKRNTSDQIVAITTDFLINGKLCVEKKFYDIL